MKKILVVDNNPIILKLIGEVLRQEGHETWSAPDVFACLDTLVEVTPDIIFIDLIMPRIGGDDLCRILRNMDHLDHCYLVIVSGIAAEEQFDFRQLGVDAVIAKGPFREMRRHILQVVAEADHPRKVEKVPELKGADDLKSRQVTRELLHNNHHLRVILESMSQGIVQLVDGRLAYINPRAALFMGTTRELLLGRRMEEVFPQPLVEAVAALPEKPQSPIPFQLGSHQVMLEQVTVDGTEPSKIIMLTDVTERRQMEAVIEAANLTRNLGYVFSGIRHEIGNPVNSIKMALSVLQRNLATYDQDTVALFLDRALQEVSRLEYLLKALKNYSLFEKPVMQELSITEFIGNFIGLIKADFAGHAITIQTILPDDPLAVLADSRALHHVMLNLVTNAADALTEARQPRIVISAARVEGLINIKVDDNGCGISETEQQNLFKPFFTSKSTGTGLGLVIVKKMLLAMDSRIGIESYPGIGTTVTVSFTEAVA